MDGLANIAGAPVELVIAGKTYRLSPLTLGHFAEIERHLESQRPNPMAAVAAAWGFLPADARGPAMAEAAKAVSTLPRIGINDLQEFILTVPGLAFLFWQAARGNHEELKDRETAMAAVCQLAPPGLALLSDAIMQVSGLAALVAALKNSPSPATEMPKPGSESPGPESTNGSPLPTASVTTTLPA
jgi:hypothetical protein